MQRRTSKLGWKVRLNFSGVNIKHLRKMSKKEAPWQPWPGHSVPEIMLVQVSNDPNSFSNLIKRNLCKDSSYDLHFYTQ